MGSLLHARGNRTKLEGAIPDTIKSPARDALRNFTWNGRNQLTGFTSKTEEAAPTPTVSATYKYNQDGLRYQKSVSTNGAAAVTTGYYYDNTGRCIAETTATGAKAAQIVWGHKPLARIVGTTWYYYHYNGHGDVVSMSDSTGKAVNTYTYDIWGNVTKKVENGVVDNPILYSGEYYDKESGLTYLRARYYDSVTGRFISRDSYEGKQTNPLSQNLYIYVGNNPLGYVDPSGHSRTKAEYAQAREWSKQNFNAREYVHANVMCVFVAVNVVYLAYEAAAAWGMYGAYATASAGIAAQRMQASVQRAQASTSRVAATVQTTLSSNSGSARIGVLVPGRNGPLPVNNVTKASNGLFYKSHTKHTPGQPGFRPNAGIEPKNSMDLFGESITSPTSTARFAFDKGTKTLHRFFDSGEGSWHWSGATNQGLNSLKSDNIPIDIRNIFGMPKKGVE